MKNSHSFKVAIDSIDVLPKIRGLDEREGTGAWEINDYFIDYFTGVWAHHENPVGETHSLFNTVGDKENCWPVTQPERLKVCPRLEAGKSIQCPEWLVKQENRWLVDDCADE